MIWTAWARTAVACLWVPLCVTPATASPPRPEVSTQYAPTWRVNEGALLSDTLREWALVSGWTVVWRLSEKDDVRMPADARYQDDFKRAVIGMFKSLPETARVHAEMREDTMPPLLLVTRDASAVGARVLRRVASAVPPVAQAAVLSGTAAAAAMPGTATATDPIGLAAGSAAPGPAVASTPRPSPGPHAAVATVPASTGGDQPSLLAAAVAAPQTPRAALQPGGPTAATVAGSPTLNAPRPQWRIQKAQPIHLALEQWAAKAGWTLIWYPPMSWKAIADVDIDSQLGVVDAVSEVINVLRGEGKALQLRVSEGNSVMEVLSTEVRND